MVRKMNELINKIEELKVSSIGKTIDGRIAEFKNFDKESNDDLFKEACFCMLTANFNAEKSIKIQNEIGDCFLGKSDSLLSYQRAKYCQKTSVINVYV